MWYFLTKLINLITTWPWNAINCWRAYAWQQYARQTAGKGRCQQICKVQQWLAGLQGFVIQHLPLWHTLLREGDADWTPVLSPGLPAAISLETPNWSLVYLWYLYGPFMGLFFSSERRMRGTDNWSWGSTGTQARRSLLNLQFNKEISHLFALTRCYKSQLSGLNGEMAGLHGGRKNMQN